MDIDIMNSFWIGCLLGALFLIHMDDNNGNCVRLINIPSRHINNCNT